jgi:hypothetical protein
MRWFSALRFLRLGVFAAARSLFLLAANALLDNPWEFPGFFTAMV